MPHSHNYSSLILDPSHLGGGEAAGYTEDITVAGSLLVDRVSRFYETVFQGRRDSSGRLLLPVVCHSGAISLLAQVNKVQLVDRLGSDPNIYGTVHVTTSHVIFKSDESGKEIWIPNGLIASVERRPLTTAGSPLTVRCKHFLTLTFLISRDKDCQDLLETLQRCGRPVNIVDVFAFQNRETIEGARVDVEREANSWNRLDWDEEFARQGVDSKWKCTEFNLSYSCCDTYPEKLWVPSAVTTQSLIASCRFRSRGRLPVLTYWHRTNGASISRCAQPLTGFSARCVEDEALMDYIAKTNPSCATLYLVDTRPRVNAMVNKVQGKGFEDVRNYSNMQFHFFDIENIHVMRNSLNKLLEVCQKPRSMNDFLRGLESSQWLKHIRSLLECGKFLADSVVRGISCVVHCSDGWDRTSQTVSIAQLILDPFYRTIRGFEVLVEKDWLGFGHKFDDRCGHVGLGTATDDSSKEISPIFTQFLDVVFQMMRQKPRAFEFNQRFLVELHEHVYSCQYGTFLGNCLKDRHDLQLSRRTQSLWNYFDSRMDDFKNPLFDPEAHTFLTNVDIHPSAIVFWTALYNRFDTGILTKECVDDVALTTQEHIGVLEQTLSSLKVKLSELKSSMGRSVSMVDSGHSSNNEVATSSAPLCDPLLNPEPSSDVPDKGVLKHQDTEESGIYDPSSMAISTETESSAIRWKSLRNVDECSARTCGAEFVTKLDRRFHCYQCGEIFCRRCVKIVADSGERLCGGCRHDEVEP
uniref:phosphatidylinositol-3,5-bisphosphate 3-phosphatase n=1 Tax=Steinernema glaseri TaxID=37863 RepID=A0A1I8AQW8_9BILA